MCTSMKRVWQDVAGVHCAGDTDLFSINACLRSPVDIQNELPASLTAWGELLLGMGGTLKLEKYVNYTVD